MAKTVKTVKTSGLVINTKKTKAAKTVPVIVEGAPLDKTTGKEADKKTADVTNNKNGASDTSVTKPVTKITLIPKVIPKIDLSKLFIPGSTIIEKLRLNPLKKELTLQSTTAAAARRHRTNITNEVAALIDSSFSKVDHVPGLKTTLYPHQQGVVKAMLDLEQERTFNMPGTSANGWVSNKISYNAGVLSEPVGSGKTIDILSVICLSKIPRAIPDVMALPYPTNVASTGFIRRRFKKFLKPTLIFVGASVMKQWENAIKTFTDLKTFSVNSIIELKVLLPMISDKSVNEYDVILVKNGKITRPITLPDDIVLEEKNRVALAYIYNILANLRNYCWARVVIDDFDTIKLPHNAGIVNAVFTWYISSTRKKMDFRTNSDKVSTCASSVLKTFDYGCANIMYNHLLFHMLNVRNDIEFLKATTNVPNPKFHVAIFKNPNDRYISLLAGMGDDDVNRITEMLNGDAIGAAAEAAGIKTTSVASIFEKILGGKFQQYKFSGDLLAFIEHLREEESGRLPMDENPDEEDRYGKKDLLAFREVEYKYPGVNGIINSTEEEYAEVKKQTGIAIDRVKDNIKNGTCPVCRIDLSDSEETIIVKCCGAVFCGTCGIKAQMLNDRYAKLTQGRCSNCRATVSIKDLIYIGDNFDLDKIQKEEFEEEEVAEVPTTVAKATKSCKPRNKYTAIVDIINGDEVPESKRVDMYIPNMMKGGAFLKEPKIRKVLVFANYDETLKNVIKELDEEKIHYWRLMGGINDINQVAMEFTKCETTCALVINSTKHCSGLNLQTATDLVFTHNIIDPAIESQVAGRGHRLGRTSPLNIWFMQYDNEYDQLVQTHGVRELSADELKQEHKFEKGSESAAINMVEDNTDACYLDGKKAPKAGKESTNYDSTKGMNISMKKLKTRNYDDADDAEEVEEVESKHHRYERNAPGLDRDNLGDENSEESNEEEEDVSEEKVRGGNLDKTSSESSETSTSNDSETYLSRLPKRGAGRPSKYIKDDQAKKKPIKKVKINQRAADAEEAEEVESEDDFIIE